jgi:hypothetical protein
MTAAVPAAAYGLVVLVASYVASWMYFCRAAPLRSPRNEKNSNRELLTVRITEIKLKEA